MIKVLYMLITTPYNNLLQLWITILLVKYYCKLWNH